MLHMVVWKVSDVSSVTPFDSDFFLLFCASALPQAAILIAAAMMNVMIFVVFMFPYV
jgi:hypothetical protein